MKKLFPILILLTSCSGSYVQTGSTKSEYPLPDMSFKCDTSAELEVPPKLIRGRLPVYPAQFLVRNKEGYSVVSFIVDKNGNVKDIKNKDSSNLLFFTRTRAAVSKWIFEPGIKDGMPVNVECEHMEEYKIRP